MKWVIVIALMAPTWAYAQGDLAEAEALFREGRALLDAGNAEKACPLLEESLRIDRGTGTLWHLGRCYEATGRLASAWATFLELAAEARKLGEPKKERAARQRADGLAPRLSTLTIDVPAGARVEGLVVTRGDREIGAAVWGTAVPVDGGTHVVRAEADGYEGWTAEVDVPAEGGAQTVTVPALVVAPEIAAPPAAADAVPWHRDTAGWVVAGAGVAVAGVGIGLFPRAATVEDDAEAQGDLDERDRLLDKSDRLRRSGGAVLALGAAAVIAGTVKLAIAPREEAPAAAPAIGPSGAPGSGGIMVGVRGRF